MNLGCVGVVILGECGGEYRCASRICDDPKDDWLDIECAGDVFPERRLELVPSSFEDWELERLLCFVKTYNWGNIQLRD